jgi:serine/threonine protein kinase
LSLTPGTRLGVYEITAQIGEGGMGQVYRGTDTTLGRQVAIKILPEAFAADPERLARFEREAKTLASLNHPNIAAVYGFEKSGGTHALVMELVEGDDLSQRIGRGAISLDEALPIAKQIAEALEAAHEQGIIHRDLKPANIKVRSDGTVKVLDFGLAKAMEPAAGVSPSVSQAPTITTPAMMTGVGVILGTAAYMSPEQARGKTVDKRADIWAFGAVLFEMLAGRRPFDGDDMTEVLGAVVRLEPQWDALPLSVPARVTQILRVCLRKDPKQRVGDIRDVRLALEGAFETAAPPAASPVVTNRRRHLAALAAGALVIAAVTGAAVWFATRSVALSAPELRLDITTPPTTARELAGIAISPDGRRVVRRDAFVDLRALCGQPHGLPDRLGRDGGVGAPPVARAREEIRLGPHPAVVLP